MSKAECLEVSVSRVIDADADKIYDVITDITRMHQFSTENVAGEWLGSATGPAVGARFKGKNAIGSTKWSTRPTITVADRGRVFEFQVPGRSGARWTYTFEAIDAGTRVTESMQQLRPSPLPIRVLQRRAGVTDRAAYLRAGMVTTLDRLADAVDKVEVKER